MTANEDQTGNLSQAMAHARELMEREPQQALLQLSEILAVVPDYTPATLLKTALLRQLADPKEALEQLIPALESPRQRRSIIRVRIDLGLRCSGAQKRWRSRRSSLQRPIIQRHGDCWLTTLPR